MPLRIRQYARAHARVLPQMDSDPRRPDEMLPPVVKRAQWTDRWCDFAKKSRRGECSNQRSEIRGQKSEVRSQRSEVRGQRSEVRSQKSEVRSQRSEVRGRRTDVGNVAGAVKTSVTLLGQNIGNTMSIIVYTFQFRLQFYSGGYPPE
jgi:hypothetical protein